MKNQNQCVRHSATVLLACGLIVSLLPGFAAAQDLSTVEGRAAYMIEQFRENPIRPNAKHGDSRMFSGPGIAWALGKYWDSFTPTR